MSECPRCQLAMSSYAYEDQPVEFCTNCWGYWVSPDAFQKILRSEVYEFSKSDKDSVLKRWSGHNSTMLRTSANIGCPTCGETMEQIPFATGCGVVVDRCKPHGVWLDGGEIKRIQIFLDERKQG